MKFEWDARKNNVNLRKHGFDLADAVPMFEGLTRGRTMAKAAGLALVSQMGGPQWLYLSRARTIVFGSSR
jgi:hypothetical protein